MFNINNVQGPNASVFTSSEQEYTKKQSPKTNKSKFQPAKTATYKDIIKKQALHQKATKTNNTLTTKPKTTPKLGFVEKKPSTKKKPLYQAKQDITKRPEKNPSASKLKQQNLREIRANSKNLADIKNHLGVKHESITTKPGLSSNDAFKQKRADRTPVNAVTKRPTAKTRNAFAMKTNNISTFKMHKLARVLPQKTTSTANTTKTKATTKNALLAKIEQQKKQAGNSKKEPIIKVSKSPKELRTIAEAVRATIREKQKENQEKQKINISSQTKKKDSRLTKHSPITTGKMQPANTTQSKQQKNISIKTQAPSTTVKHKKTTLKTSIEYLEEVTTKRTKNQARQKQIQEQTLKQQHKLNEQLEQQIYNNRLLNNRRRIEDIVKHQQKESTQVHDWLKYETQKKEAAEKKFIDKTIKTNEVIKCTQGLTNNRIEKELKNFYFLDKKPHPDPNIDTQI